MAGVELLVAVASTDARSPPGRRGAENQRRASQKGEKNTGFARFVGGGLRLLGQRVDTLFGVGLGKTGARRDDANQIGAVIAAQRTIGGSANKMRETS